MSVEDAGGHWDLVVSSLQDICNANESLSFNELDGDYTEAKLNSLGESELEALKEEVNDHYLNIGTAKRIIVTSQENLRMLIENAEKLQQQQQQQQQAASTRSSRSSVVGKAHSKKGNAKEGKVYWKSKFSPSEPLVVGSEVAFKLKNRYEEWIQCEVTKILGDGTKFEVRDPEPDENNNPGQKFKANCKDVILIATKSTAASLPPYPYHSKVLARYPETTTFYPAVVVGAKKDGKVRLKFDGEEEVNKETEVDRRLVLPLPERT